MVRRSVPGRAACAAHAARRRDPADVRGGARADRGGRPARPAQSRRWLDAIWIPAAVLLATAIYAWLGRRDGEQLAQMRPLGADARRVAPDPVRWGGLLAKSVGAGLIIGGIALVIDLETDGLAVVLAVALRGRGRRRWVATATRRWRDTNAPTAAPSTASRIRLGPRPACPA